MARLPPPLGRTHGTLSARCPECGSGDLFAIEVARRDGGVWRGAYCAGEYDRDRRRFVRRSCGYAGSSLESGIGPDASPPGFRSSS
jgi:hypothetical protein